MQMDKPGLSRKIRFKNLTKGFKNLIGKFYCFILHATATVCPPRQSQFGFCATEQQPPDKRASFAKPSTTLNNAQATLCHISLFRQSHTQILSTPGSQAWRWDARWEAEQSLHYKDFNLHSWIYMREIYINVVFLVSKICFSNTTANNSVRRVQYKAMNAKEPFSSFICLRKS